MEQLIPQLTGRMTEEEYLRMEETAGNKHEFWNGTIIDMAGATSDHVRITSNLNRHLGNRLDGKPCAAYGSDLRVRIKETGQYFYPDVTVVCGPLEYARPDRRTTIINPQVIIEVASPSSEARDFEDKFDDYRRLDSLQEYFLVSQDRLRVQSFYRHSEGIWSFGPSYVQLDQLVKFRTLNIEIPLSDIYTGVQFPAPQAKDKETD